MLIRNYCAIGWIVLGVLFSVTALSQSVVPRIVPESGIYVDSSQPSTGYVLEIQNDTFGFYILSYGADGEPEFLLASGSISGGFGGRLFRVTGGRAPGAVLPGVQISATPVGTIALYSQLESPGAPVYGTVFLDLTLDEPPANTFTHTTYALTRANFGFGAVGTNLLGGACWPDMRGEWVFVDKSNTGRTAWRFKFTEASITGPLNCNGSGNDKAAVFSDPAGRAQMRCVHNASADVLDGRIKFPGCEVRIEGATEPLFSFDSEDIMLKRLIGSEGGLTVVGSGSERRRTGRVLGLRAD